MAEKGGIKTHFTDAVVPESDLGGDWGGTKDGDGSVPSGQKGTRGKIPEVTFVDVQGAPGRGESAGVGSEIANRKGSTLKD